MQEVQEVPFSRFSAAARLIADAVQAKAFPAAVVEVGNETKILWSQPFGHLTFEPASPVTGVDALFDLASLTKVLATTPIVMQEVERGTLALDDPVARHIDA